MSWRFRLFLLWDDHVPVSKLFSCIVTPSHVLQVEAIGLLHRPVSWAMTISHHWSACKETGSVARWKKGENKYFIKEKNVLVKVLVKVYIDFKICVTAPNFSSTMWAEDSEGGYTEGQDLQYQWLLWKDRTCSRWLFFHLKQCNAKRKLFF